MEEYNVLQSTSEECKKGLTKIYHTVTFSKLREKICFLSPFNSTTIHASLELMFLLNYDFIKILMH